MIKRIVKMEFDENHCNDFMEFTAEIKQAIRNFEGCRELDILRDVRNPNIFFTCSIWENTVALDNYRKSDFFNIIWPKTKKWFSAKPLAWSAEIV